MLHPSFSQIRRARSSPDLCSKRLGCWIRPEVRWTTTSMLRHLIDHLDNHVLLKGGLYPNQPATFHQSNCNQLIPVYHQASNSQMYYQSTPKVARRERLSSISYTSFKQSRVATSLKHDMFDTPVYVCCALHTLSRAVEGSSTGAKQRNCTGHSYVCTIGAVFALIRQQFCEDRLVGPNLNVTIVGSRSHLNVSKA